MTRSALCLRGNGALRVRLLPRADAGAAHQAAGAVAFKEITEPVDAVQLEWSCAAALSALQAGAVCQSDALRALSATQVQGTPLQLACLWHTALAVLVASGHAVRSGLWFTASATCCKPAGPAVLLGDEASASAVDVNVSLKQGRLVALRRPASLTREARRRGRGRSRVQKPHRPRGKPERQKGEAKAPKISVKRVAFAADV